MGRISALLVLPVEGTERLRLALRKRVMWAASPVTVKTSEIRFASSFLVLLRSVIGYAMD